MAKTRYSATEAAQALGISVDTLRRWDREGRIKTTRDASNNRVVSAREIKRLRGDDSQHLSARNRFGASTIGVPSKGICALPSLAQFGLRPFLVTAKQHASYAQ